ncbi:hypothetical protein BGW36DRAFT_430268 [Talaromyces proteolyticus]|uniref:Uncharacterized protein n=1 Tax=Talaromyces proteolyticus TaxID=1131652 RepID=A0AAD4KNH2_9EURO|nr:uncharacterized protein BGW36DRAFT_430268 [Talaromyces proteolyticus]KAH8694250.1 hypothetical protein BGW36DRAFT_430268 [Talaromyces proteolyticus]
MTLQSSASSSLRTPPNMQKQLPSRPTDFILVEPDEGLCTRGDKELDAYCLPGPNQAILRSWKEDEPFVMHADYPYLDRTPFTCFTCDDFIVFVSKTKVLMARLRMDSIFNGDIEEAKRLGSIAKSCLDWREPVECYILTPELGGAKGPEAQDLKTAFSRQMLAADAENHYISYIKRWGSRFRQCELELFFWKKWDMAPRIHLTVVAYQPFYDPNVAQSSCVVITNGKAREILNMEELGDDTTESVYVSRQHETDGIFRNVTTKVGEYGPWKAITIPSRYTDVSLFTVGFRGKQRNEGFTEYWKSPSRKFGLVYNS